MYSLCTGIKQAFILLYIRHRVCIKEKCINRRQKVRDLFKGHSTRCADNVKKRCDLECGARVCLLKTIASFWRKFTSIADNDRELQSYDYDEKPKSSIALWPHVDTKINATENWICTVLFRVNARQEHYSFMVRFHYDTVSMQGIITNACFFDLTVLIG